MIHIFNDRGVCKNPSIIFACSIGENTVEIYYGKDLDGNIAYGALAENGLIRKILPYVKENKIKEVTQWAIDNLADFPRTIEKNNRDYEKVMAVFETFIKNYI